MPASMTGSSSYRFNEPVTVTVPWHLSIIAGEDLPRDQLRGRLNVSRPAYVVAVALQEALGHLDNAEDTPLSKGKETDYLPHAFTQALNEKMAAAAGAEALDEEVNELLR
ncbi:uncharacterized protein FRV6_02815 [Fusarium oxysporum]|uniref:Uncharacterized protein n=1 Tax=Fusarium oxysporum TaxID=5507 RepID=A0A2H3SQ65_FUSOX|nr:uncharacterized protein FRV6_02815 [Fusarium oxysporum]